MLKPDLLRQEIARRLPSLKRDPERLLVWIDEGRVMSRGDSLEFGYAYQCTLVVEDFTDHPSALMVVIIAWLKRHQPDLLEDPDKKGFRFQADILDNEKVDIAIELDLTENVLVTERGDGGYDMEHVDCPHPLFPDEEPMSDPAAALREIYMGGEQVVPLQADGG